MIRHKHKLREVALLQYSSARRMQFYLLTTRAPKVEPLNGPPWCVFVLSFLYLQQIFCVCGFTGAMDDVLDCVCTLHSGGDHHRPFFGLVNTVHTLTV